MTLYSVEVLVNVTMHTALETPLTLTFQDANNKSKLVPKVQEARSWKEIQIPESKWIGVSKMCLDFDISLVTR